MTLVNPCPGIERSSQALCLPDLLLSSPSEWMDKPFLRFRRDDGVWVSWPRVRVQQAVLRMAAWLENHGVKCGDRVGLLGHNSPEWLIADFAILRIGGVTVPAYFTDAAEAVRYVFDDAQCSLVMVEPAQRFKLKDYDKLLLPFRGEGESLESVAEDDVWDSRLHASCPQLSDLATLIYTSGTTGHPKGVMLTHGNLLADVHASLRAVPVFPDDLFLSFLPVSHAFERTIGQFLPVASGAEIAYAEDVTTLMRDMPEVQPTVIISVPRLYEKIYASVQAKLATSIFKAYLFKLAQYLGWKRFELRQDGVDLKGIRAVLWNLLDTLVYAKLREKMGGKLRLFISGGAALSPRIAKFLLAADMTVLSGYGLSESSPVLTVNIESRIKPDSVGVALPGVELKLALDGELLAKGDMVMAGYWHRSDASKEALDDDGWLHTGDIAEIDSEGYVFIIDRKKDILVLSSGENVPPTLLEQHLLHDPCIEQVMVVGEAKTYLVALLLVDEAQLMRCWKRRKLPSDLNDSLEFKAWMLGRMQKELHQLASYMQIRKFIVVGEAWLQDTGCLTPTFKLKRQQISALHKVEIDKLYSESDLAVK